MSLLKRSFGGMSPCGIALLAAACGARVASAQTLRIQLRDSVSDAAVVGALVSATDSSGRVRADALSDERGAVTLRVPAAGTWSLVIRRIGLTPRRLDALRLSDGETLTLAIVLTGIRQLLPTVRVTADAGVCGHAPTGDSRVATLWEQISLALRASEISRVDSSARPRLQIAEHVRELTESLEMKSARLTRSGFGAARPYSAVDPDTLVERGYVRREIDGDFSYYAPDEVVLLSESFLETHCFDTPADDEDPTLAELRFRPVRGRAIPDVAGTAFVDAFTGELRRIEFRFVETRRVLPLNARHAGGDVSLLRLLNGQWIVASWSIRMPLFARIGRRGMIAVLGYREVGGIADPVEQHTPDD